MNSVSSLVHCWPRQKFVTKAEFTGSVANSRSRIRRIFSRLETQTSKIDKLSTTHNPIAYSRSLNLSTKHAYVVCEVVICIYN